MLTEEQLEQSCIDWFREIGWEYELGYDIAPGSDNPKRKDYKEVLIVERLREALSKINPHIPSDKLEEVILQLARPESPNLTVNNRQFHRYVNDGIPVDLRVDGGEIRGDFVKVIDFENIKNNNFLVVNQFTIAGKNGRRRPDIIAFINGLPIAVLELKNPVDENADIWKAYEQIGTYKEELPDLFAYNVASIISDGSNARIGSITAGKEWFNYWRTLKIEEDRPESELQLETMVRGFFDKELLLDYLRYFVIFEEDAGVITKKIAGYHQFHAVREAVNSTVEATQNVQDGKCGVVWHTQGSGKSISMTCYAAKLMNHPQMNNPTLVVVTDRNDLDGQLYQTFSSARELLREEPQQADTRDDLRQLLNRPSGGIIFTTIQKFSLMNGESRYPELTNRNNVVVISDEAHRSQYGFKAKVSQTDGTITYGYAKHLRDALPNAGFIGFTGTPISREDRDTQEVFGRYVSIYDIEQSVTDGATVPIYYESRLAELQLSSEGSDIDEEIDAIMEQSQDSSDSYANAQKKKWSALEKLVTAEPRLKQVAQNLVAHWENRLRVIDGKAMIVCISREACVGMYNQITTLKPDWAGTLNSNGKPSLSDGVVRVVMTGSASDRKELRNHVYDRGGRKELERRYKNPQDPLNIVIVCDMWLTGFDAPIMHTMYIDKPMRGANLMQAIARVNRVFKDKPGGLVVDYLGIANELQEALKTYTQSKGKGKPTIDAYDALTVLVGKIDHARDMLKGVDYSKFRDPKKMLPIMAQACDHIVDVDEGKTFCDTVLAITKANALCGTMPEALEYREEIAFFQAIKATLTKRVDADRKISDEQVQNALRQIVSNALVSDKVIDIFEVAGLQKPDISILSDSFLEEVSNIEQKNLAVKMLERLLKGEIKTRTASNIIQNKKYSELLDEALLRYRNRSIQAAQVIEMLVQIAKDLRKAGERGKELGLNKDELAFYDALANNESAVQELGDEILKKIAHELTVRLRKSVTIVDWAKRESIRAAIRLEIRNLLRKYKYPPDKQDSAVRLVLEQAEALSESQYSS